MRKWIGIIVLAAVLTIPLVKSELYVDDIKDIDVVLEDITPKEIHSGDEITLTIRVVNKGNKEGIVNSLELLLPSFFTYIDSYPSINESFKLCGGCSKLYFIYLKSKETTPTATYPLTIIVNEPNVVLKKKYELKVVSEPYLIIEGKNIKIYPSQSKKMEINLKNVGEGDAHDIFIMLNTNDFTLAGTNVIYVKELRSNQSLTLPIKIFANEELEPNIYKIPFTIEFKDDVNNKMNREYTLTADVISNVTLSFSSIIVEPTTIRIGDKGRLIIRVENLGEGTAKNIKVRVESDLPLFYTKSYIGSLEEDEDSSVVFSFEATKPGKHTFTITCEYEDDVGKKEIKERYEIYVRYRTDYVKYIVGLIILIILIGLWRYKNRGKN